MDINDITKQLAAKFSGLTLEPEKKPEPEPEPERDSYRSLSSSFDQRRSHIVGQGKLWPSEKVGLTSRPKVAPRRAPCRLSDFTDDELDWMFDTPVRRNMNFEDWLETIGLPPDLDEKHDGCIYTYAARNYLARKQESHRR